MSKDIGQLQDKNGNSLFPNNIDVYSTSTGFAYCFADGTMIQGKYSDASSFKMLMCLEYTKTTD